MQHLLNELVVNQDGSQTASMAPLNVARDVILSRRLRNVLHENAGHWPDSFRRARSSRSNVAIHATATLNADSVVFQYSSSCKVSQSHAEIVQVALPSSSHVYTRPYFLRVIRESTNKELQNHWQSPTANITLSVSLAEKHCP